MSWWQITVAVWFVVSFGSAVAVLAAAAARERQARRRRADVDATFDALMATLDPGPRTMA